MEQRLRKELENGPIVVYLARDKGEHDPKNKIVFTLRDQNTFICNRTRGLIYHLDCADKFWDEIIKAANRNKEHMVRFGSAQNRNFDAKGKDYDTIDAIAQRSKLIHNGVRVSTYLGPLMVHLFGGSIVRVGPHRPQHYQVPEEFIK